MAELTSLQKEIIKLKKEKDALILAHYYVPLEVQDVADKVGDSFALAKYARSASQKLIVVCGVRFMGESAKILSPDKKVLMPAADAGCPMADMVTPEDIAALRKANPGAAVMCYVNSSAAVKAASDICCTSSSALRVAESLEEKEVIFVPDRNLGRFVAEKVPGKKFIIHNGCCPIHNDVTAEDVKSAMAAHPGAVLAAHPECRREVLDMAKYIGSTADILKFSAETDYKEILICTENEIVDRLRRDVPDKSFWQITPKFVCGNMKKNTAEALRNCLADESNEIVLSDEEIRLAFRSLDRMVNV